MRGRPGVGGTTLLGVISQEREVQEALWDGVLWTPLTFGEDDLSPRHSV